jgi:hypothetical protein
MEKNIGIFLLKQLLIIGLAFLLILMFGVFAPSSWAAFDRYFPNNTVYEVNEFASGFHGGDANAWGANDQLFILKETFTFMSNGTFTASYSNDDGLNRFIGDDQDGNNTFSTTYSPESGTDNGTYSISSDGEVTITFDPGGEDEETFSGTLSEDGQTVIFAYSEYSNSNRYSTFGIGVGVKKGTGFSNTLPNNTVYEVNEFDSGFHGGDADAWGANDQLFILKETFTFMSNGTFTASYSNDDGLNRFIGDDQDGNNTFSTTYSPESGTDNGTYSISSDGEVTITFDPGGEDEETFSGTLSEDGQTVIFAYSEYSNSDRYSTFGIGVGVKKSVDEKGDLSSLFLLLLGD